MKNAMTASNKQHCTAVSLNSTDRILCFAEVPVHNHRVIYDLMDTVRGIMEGRLSSVEQVTEIGSAEVRAVFGSGSRKIAGCMVNEGSLKKGCTVEVGLTTLFHPSPSASGFQNIRNAACCSAPYTLLAVNLRICDKLYTSK